MPTVQPTAIIIGAGITGLTTALALKRKGVQVTVLEKNQQIGGVIQSREIDGYLIESGPNSMLIKSPTVRHFLDSLPINDQETPANPQANKRFLVRDNKIQALPHSLFGALTTPLYSPIAKLKFLLEPWRPRTQKEDTSVAEFVTRRLGPEFHHYAIAPMVSGIFAGDTHQLSIRYAFPKVWALEAGSGSLIRGTLRLRKERRQSGVPPFKPSMISYQRGLTSLIQAIAEEVGQENIHTGQSIQSIEEEEAQWIVRTNQPQPFSAQRLIITAPTHQWTALPLPASFASILQHTERPYHPPVSTLVLGFHRKQIRHPLDGFGVLVPPIEKSSILGAIFSSSIFPHRAPPDHVSLMVFLGGTTLPEAAQWDTPTTIHSALQALKPLLEIEGDPTFSHHTHWPQAIPQYDLSHGTFLKLIQAIEEKHPGLHLVGSFAGGPGLNDCIQSALNLAQAID